MIKIITLAFYLFNAMTSWVPESQHSYYEKEAVTDARYMDIALAIAEVALDPNQEPLFDGDEGRVQTALVLASIASHESKFVSNIVNCQKSGDHGLAWGAFQTHSNKARTCASLVDATTIALAMARNSLNHCQTMALPDRLSIYTNGQCRSSSASRARVNRALYYFAKNKPEPIQTDEGNE